MNEKRSGAPDTDFWEVVSGMNADMDSDTTVELLSRDPNVVCFLGWATLEGVDRATFEECREFLIQRKCMEYGFIPEQLDAALTVIEQNVMEARVNGQA